MKLLHIPYIVLCGVWMLGCRPSLSTIDKNRWKIVQVPCSSNYSMALSEQLMLGMSQRSTSEVTNSAAIAEISSQLDRCVSAPSNQYPILDSRILVYSVHSTKDSLLFAISGTSLVYRAGSVCAMTPGLRAALKVVVPNTDCL